MKPAGDDVTTCRFSAVTVSPCGNQSESLFGFGFFFSDECILFLESRQFMRTWVFFSSCAPTRAPMRSLFRKSSQGHWMEADSSSLCCE